MKHTQILSLISILKSNILLNNHKQIVAINKLFIFNPLRSNQNDLTVLVT